MYTAPLAVKVAVCCPIQMEGLLPLLFGNGLTLILVIVFEIQPFRIFAGNSIV